MKLMQHIWKFDESGFTYYYSPFHNMFVKTNFDIEQGQLTDRERKVLIENKIMSDNEEEGFIASEFAAAQNEDIVDLVIMPNTDCNFKCTYCYQHKNTQYMDESLVDAIVKLIKKQLAKHNRLHITWFGGEPSLSMDMIERVNTEALACARKMRKIFTSSMTTNGYLLTKDVFRKLLQLNVRKFQITIDGIREIHDSARKLRDGSGTFDQIIENIKEMKTVPSALFDIMIRCNVDNLSTIGSFCEYMEQILARDNRFSLYFYPICKWPQSNKSQLDFTAITQEAFRYSNRVNIMQKNMHYGNYCNANKSFHYVIGVKGDIYKCTIRLEDEKNRIGRLNENGELELDSERIMIWNLSYRYSTLSKQDKLSQPYKIMCPYHDVAVESKLLAHYITDNNTLDLLR